MREWKARWLGYGYPDWIPKSINVGVDHLYLPLTGPDQEAQLDVTAELFRSQSLDEVLVGGGWSYGNDYVCFDKRNGPVFAPEWLRNELNKRGVPLHRIHAALPISIRHWLLNVVSTWGEVKQMHRLLRQLIRDGRARHVYLFFIAHPTHGKRAIWLWRCYNWLMIWVRRGVWMTIAEPVPLGIEADPKWLKGEWLRNLIAYIDPFGLHLAFLIHLKRRWDARRACAGQQ